MLRKKRLTMRESRRLWIFTAWIVAVFFFVLFMLIIFLGPRIPYSTLMGIPQIKQFMDSNPGANINETFISKSDSSSVVSKVLEECGKDVEQKDYVLVEISANNTKISAYFDPATKEEICVYSGDGDGGIEGGEGGGGGGEGGADAGQGSGVRKPCTASSQCNDRNPYTEDACISGYCSNAPMTCSQAGGEICSQGDACPYEAVALADGMCCLGRCQPIAQDQCSSDAECDDGKENTMDTCTGTPKSCTHRLKACGEMGYAACGSGQECAAGFVQAADSAYCCPSSCYSLYESGCSTDADCASGNLLFVGACVSGYCRYTSTGLCGSGDDYCPEQCTPENDGDCT